MGPASRDTLALRDIQDTVSAIYSITDWLLLGLSLITSLTAQYCTPDIVVILVVYAASWGLHDTPSGEAQTHSSRSTGALSSVSSDWRESVSVL